LTKWKWGVICRVNVVRYFVYVKLDRQMNFYEYHLVSLDHVFLLRKFSSVVAIAHLGPLNDHTIS